MNDNSSRYRPKNRKKKNNVIYFLLPVTIITTTLFFSQTLAERYGSLALLFAGSAMPEGSLNMVIHEIEGETVVEEIKSVNSSSDTTEESVTAQSKTVSKTVSGNLTKTPDDILALIEKAKTEQANYQKDGNITEITYTKTNATNVYDGVTVKNATHEHSIDIKQVLSEPVDLKITDKSVPTVLIFHTHTTESYEMLDRGWYSNTLGTRNKDKGLNMVRVGDAITEQLQNAGFAVIHDTEIHDLSYNGSYADSRKAIDAYKKKYPNLQVILDIHRDAIKYDNGTKVKPTATINGKKAAQIMIITGCQELDITEFDDWEYNLRFAVQLQKTAEELFPGLMRPVYFSARKYNMNTSRCSLLLEMGSDSNTLEEAVYSGSMIGYALADLMQNYVTKS